VAANPPPVSAAPAGLDRPWRVWASAIAGAFVLVCLLLGLIVLPAREQTGFDAVAAICRAIGLPGYEAAPPKTAAPGTPPSDVAWTVATRRLLADANAARGAAIVRQTCAACHGESGISVDPQQFPNLAGQSDAAIFKELRDFQSGARKSDIMAALAQPLTPQQMADVAAYYAARRPADVLPDDTGVSLDITRLARQGDTARAIPACDSCHGPSRSGPEGAPLLLGQPSSYLETQLRNFAGAARRNDVFERMRVIAGQLTPQEMRGLAIYYGGLPAPRYAR
jgi:cytochrome c553